MTIVYVEVTPSPRDVASCLHCGRLVILLPWPFAEQPDSLAVPLAWNPSIEDYPAILAQLDPDALHRQGFGPPDSLHIKDCKGLYHASKRNYRRCHRHPPGLGSDPMGRRRGR